MQCTHNFHSHDQDESLHSGSKIQELNNLPPSNFLVAKADALTLAQQVDLFDTGCQARLPGQSVQAVLHP